MKFYLQSTELLALYDVLMHKCVEHDDIDPELRQICERMRAHIISALNYNLLDRWESDQKEKIASLEKENESIIAATTKLAVKTNPKQHDSPFL